MLTVFSKYSNNMYTCNLHLVNFQWIQEKQPIVKGVSRRSVQPPLLQRSTIHQKNVQYHKAELSHF